MFLLKKARVFESSKETLITWCRCFRGVQSPKVLLGIFHLSRAHRLLSTQDGGTSLYGTSGAPQWCHINTDVVKAVLSLEYSHHLIRWSACGRFPWEPSKQPVAVKTWRGAFVWRSAPWDFIQCASLQCCCGSVTWVMWWVVLLRKTSRAIFSLRCSPELGWLTAGLLAAAVAAAAAVSASPRCSAAQDAVRQLHWRVTWAETDSSWFLSEQL